MSNRSLQYIFGKEALNMFPRAPKPKRPKSTLTNILYAVLAGIVINIGAYNVSSDYKQFIKGILSDKNEYYAKEEKSSTSSKKKRKEGAPKIKYESSIVIYNPSDQVIDFIDESGNSIRSLTLVEYDEINDRFGNAKAILNQRHIGNTIASKILQEQLDKKAFEFFGLILQEGGFKRENRDQAENGAWGPCQLEENAFLETQKYISELEDKKLSELTPSENIATGFVYRYYVIEKYLIGELKKIGLDYNKNIAEKDKFLNGVYNAGQGNIGICLNSQYSKGKISKTSLLTRGEFVTLSKKYCTDNIVGYQKHRGEYPAQVDQFERGFTALQKKDIIDTPSDIPNNRETNMKIALSEIDNYLGTDYGHNNGKGNIDCSQLIKKGLSKAGLVKKSFQPKEYLANGMFDYYVNIAGAKLKEPKDIEKGDLIFRYEDEKDNDNHPTGKMYHIAMALSNAKIDLESGKVYCKTIESTTDGSFDGAKVFESRELKLGRHVAISRELAFQTILKDYSKAGVNPLAQ